MTATRHEGVEAPRHPTLVIALEGWIDAGFAGATAAGALLEAIPTEILFTFDGDDLLDRRARRPRMRIEDGVQMGISWPETTLRVGRDPSGNPVAFLVGPEPDYHWRSFTDEVAAIARSLEPRLVVSLGAFPAAFPHTRPVLLASTASSSALAHQVGFVPGTIEAPAGLADVIAAHLSEAGVPAVGLWARVPHYVAAMPFPAAAVAILAGLTALSGVRIDTSDLEVAAAATRQRVDELIQASTEHLDMVRQLEEQYGLDEDGSPTGFSGGIPSGEEIAAELERYLRGEMQ